MATSRIVVSLNKTERFGLTKLAEQELRSPRDQIRHILRQELERHGLLPAADQGNEYQVGGMSDGDGRGGSPPD